MTPEQEREKLEAERRADRKQYAEEKFVPGKCIVCHGRGYALFGRYPTLLTCHVCNGTGKSK